MKYSIIDTIYLCVCVIRSKLISSNIRLIRFPIDLRGRQYINFGRNFTTGRYCRLEVYENNGVKPVLKIGDDVQINDFVHITVMDSVTIGNNVLIASHAYISDCQHGHYSGMIQSSPESPPAKRNHEISPVIVEDNVWICDQVCVLPGVVIGKGSIIGANSVVTKSIPPGSIAVGSPAVVIKKWDYRTNSWVKCNVKH